MTESKPSITEVTGIVMGKTISTRLIVVLARHILDVDPEDRCFVENLRGIGEGTFGAAVFHEPIKGGALFVGILHENRPAEADDAVEAGAAAALPLMPVQFPQDVHLEADPVVPAKDVEFPPLRCAVEIEAVFSQAEIHRHHIGHPVVG